MNKDFLSWLGHAGSHTCMIENAGTTYYFVRVQKNEDFDYLYCQRQYSCLLYTSDAADEL